MSEAAFQLIQVLSNHGVTAGEIKISFGTEAPEGVRVDIQLPALTDSLDTQPDFTGLRGVFALFSEGGTCE
ncbi:hypothetical protein [Paenarthrobacter nicotinovorans]|uniref:hypothetical protein n=1 Tax=Paenarthrobacter nicotinovorans TaxID=29320 RepID=UPI0012DCC118|nr:hypothetical protein [Paenarthrobacter nicotinovorans]